MYLKVIKFASLTADRENNKNVSTIFGAMMFESCSWVHFQFNENKPIMTASPKQNTATFTNENKAEKGKCEMKKFELSQFFCVFACYISLWTLSIFYRKSFNVSNCPTAMFKSTGLSGPTYISFKLATIRRKLFWFRPDFINSMIISIRKVFKLAYHGP